VESLLREYGAHAVPRSVDLEKKFAGKIGLLEDRGGTHAGFKGVEGPGVLRGPIPKNSFPSEVKERLCDTRVIGHNVAIVTHKTQEFADFSGVSGDQPIGNAQKFLFVHL
jgi:hypothetical protein